MQDGKAGRLTYAPASAKEEEQIREGLATFISDNAVHHLLKGNNLLIGKGRRTEVFLVSEPLWKLVQVVQPHHPYFIGAFLGELKNSEFHPSLHILHRLAELVKPSAKVVTVTSGEQRFLYGHPLQTHEFQSEKTDVDLQKKVLVVNSKGEGLGYGRFVKTASGVELKNQQDLGWYLRRGR